jgi:hypothetical protein
MDQAAVDRLRAQLTELRRGVDELDAQYRDFPALSRNLARMRASLQMASIAMGLATPDMQGEM